VDTHPKMTGNWRRVSRRHPCPICGHDSWCTVSPDGKTARCMRIASDRPSPGRDGSVGYLHRLDGPAGRGEYVAPPPAKRSIERGPADVVRLVSRWLRDTRRADLEAFASRLGVVVASLERLGTAWAPPHRAWAFPMFDGSRRPIGVRLRGTDGGKFCVRGTHNGLFWPRDLHTDTNEPLLLPEGPTDTAALLTLGYDAIGRPSCNGGAPFVVEAVRRLHRSEIVIVADADPPKRTPDGRTIRPGPDGARALAADLTAAGHRPRIIAPLAGKDVRDWVWAGATRDDIDRAIAQARYWRGRRAS